MSSPQEQTWEDKAKELRMYGDHVLPKDECFAIAGAKLTDWLRRRDTRDTSIVFYPQGGRIEDTYTDEFVKLYAHVLKTCTCENHKNMREGCVLPNCSHSNAAVCPTVLDTCGHVFCMTCILNKRCNFGCIAQTSCPRCATHFYAYGIKRLDGKQINIDKWQNEHYTEADI